MFPFSPLSLRKVVHREWVTLESQLELLRPVASTWPDTHSLSLTLCPSRACAGLWVLSDTLSYNSVTWQDTYFKWPNAFKTPQALCQNHRKRILPPQESAKNSRKFVLSKNDLFFFGFGFVFVCSCLFLLSRIMPTRLTVSYADQWKASGFNFIPGNW